LELARGDLAVCEVANTTELAAELARLAPSEILLPEDADTSLIADDAPLTLRPTWHFDRVSARRRLQDFFHVAALDGFGCADRPHAVAAAGALIEYIEATQHNACAHITGMRSYAIDDTLILDAATRRHLEIDHNARGETRGSLIGLLDHCASAMGARMLPRWLAEPLRDFERLRHRHHAVGVLTNADNNSVRSQLRAVADIERIATRIALGTARPRDLTGLRNTLLALPQLKALLAPLDAPLLAQLDASLDPQTDTCELLQ